MLDFAITIKLFNVFKARTDMGAMFRNKMRLIARRGVLAFAADRSV